MSSKSNMPDALCEVLQIFEKKRKHREETISSEFASKLTEKQRKDLKKTYELLTLVTAMIKIYGYGSDGRFLILKEIVKGDPDYDPERVKIIMEASKMLKPPKFRESRNIIHQHKSTTHDVIDSLVENLPTDTRNVVVVFDLDNTLITQPRNIVAQFEAMVDIPIKREVQKMIKETMSLQQLSKYDSSGICVSDKYIDNDNDNDDYDDNDKIGPNNLKQLLKLVEAENICFVILTKRNRDGIAEIKQFIEGLLPRSPLIGTIDENGNEIGKEDIVRVLVELRQAKVLHFVDDAKHHRKSIRKEFITDPDLDEVHIYDVDLQDQLTKPILEKMIARHNLFVDTKI